MGKALPILGIIGASFAMLAALVLVNAAVFIVIPVALAGSIVLLAQRNTVGAVAGLLVLVLTVVAALGLAGSVTTKNSSADFGISEAMGRVWAIAACLAIPMGAIAARWDGIDPDWLSWVGIGCAALAFILALVNRDNLAEQNHAIVLVTGALLLVPIAPMVAILRSGRPLPPAE